MKAWSACGHSTAGVRFGWAATALERLVEALRGRGCQVLRRGESRLRAQCPSHADNRPSLAVDVRDGRILLHCFAGCSNKTIISDLNLTWADLYEHGPVPGVTGPQAIVDTYEYATVDGDVYGRKLRFGPRKAFAWERWDGDRRDWLRKLGGLTPGLFNLERVQDVRDVLVVEGEKAVRLLGNLGFSAVAPPYGASAWKSAWTEALWQAGVFRVAVLPDRDAKGEQHAARVAATCYAWRPTLSGPTPGDPAPDVRLEPTDPEAAPLNVKLVSLPGLQHGEDVFDWIVSHGHTADDLRTLIASTPAWAPVDPVARRRELTRARVRRLRARRRALADPTLRSAQYPRAA
jgi:putative DNA primase/helicase